MAFRFGIAFASCLLLAGASGCSSRVETHIRSDGSGVAGTSTLMWQPEAEDGSPDSALVRAREAVSARLQERGFRFAGQAPVMLSVGLAERPARLAVRSGDDALSLAPKERRGLFSCRSFLTRLSVSLTDSASGQVLYNGSAQEAHCRAEPGRLLPHLAASALADLAAPKGSRVAISPLPK